MEPIREVDCGLSNLLARPLLLFGWALLLLAALVGGVLPPIDQWTFWLWFTILVIAFDFWEATVRKPGPLSNLQVAAVVSLSLAVTFWLILSEATETGLAVNYLLGYLSISVSLVLLRGHVVVATTTSATVLLALLWWDKRNGFDALGQVESFAKPLIATAMFWAVLLTVQSIARQRSKSVSAQVEMLVGEDSSRNLSVNSGLVRRSITSIVKPILERISLGDLLTTELHSEIATADEEVRYLLRRDAPDRVQFAEAIRRFRGMGVEVGIVGSEDSSIPPISDRLASQIELILGAPNVKSATIRFVPKARGGGITVVVGRADFMRRYEFDTEGRMTGDPL